jgi:hypothetical protein
MECEMKVETEEEEDDLIISNSDEEDGKNESEPPVYSVDGRKTKTKEGHSIDSEELKT